LEELKDMSNQSNKTHLPDSFRYIGIYDFVKMCGVPDVVTYSPSPYHRIALWFEDGIAAEFYVRNDPPNRDLPPAFGSVTKTIYFSYQDLDGYHNRWPYKYTYPTAIFLIDRDVPSERNPFDFNAMIATITAESSRTPTPTYISASYTNSYSYAINW
jgi:hypothetical protein